MANIADTCFKITGSYKAVNDLWNKLNNLNVNKTDVPLFKLAEMYGIDWNSTGISVRGHVYFADLEEEEDGEFVLSLDTESAWEAPVLLIEEINKKLEDALWISYREVEPGEGIFYVHDERNFFPEECCVSSCGKPFENVDADVYSTIGDACKEWSRLMGVAINEARTDKEMMDYINEYEYEDDSTYFYIHPFVFGEL